MPKKQDKLKDSLGRARTMSLFRETMPQNSPFDPVFTLEEKSKDGLPSAKEIYMSAEDPTEYTPAMRITGNWQVWKRITESEWFKPYIDEWREELEVKIRSKHLQSIMGIAAEGSETQAMKASQFLYKENWMGGEGSSTKSKRGRPTKAEIAHEKRVRAAMEKESEETLKRLGLLDSKADRVDA